jgi:hypothetical protein
LNCSASGDDPLPVERSIIKSGLGRNTWGASQESSIAMGNQGWLGKNSVTRSASASSLINFDRINWIRLNGGKQKPARFFQLKLKASTFHAWGWGNQLTKRGRWRFNSDEKKATWTSQIDERTTSNRLKRGDVATLCAPLYSKHREQK